MHYQMTILSLGWGVQSWTLSAMAALGEIEKPDFILHADTTWEHEETYRFAKQWTPWLRKHGLNVITTLDYEAANVIMDQEKHITHLPLFTLSPSGKKGQLRRSCTDRWKIRPQRRVMNQLLNDAGIRRKAGVIGQLIGISLDEWCRMKDSDVKYVELVSPLVDMRISRSTCQEWLKEKGLPIPPKSSCVMCPYHSNHAWWKLREAGGNDWETCLKVDRAIRHKRPGFECYLTDQRRPLDKLNLIEFETPELFDLSAMPCDSGHCFL